LKPPGFNRYKVKNWFQSLLSFKFNLYRYTAAVHRFAKYLSENNQDSNNAIRERDVPTIQMLLKAVVRERLRMNNQEVSNVLWWGSVQVESSVLIACKRLASTLEPMK
jgi:hypothetical protein